MGPSSGPGSHTRSSSLRLGEGERSSSWGPPTRQRIPAGTVTTRPSPATTRAVGRPSAWATAPQMAPPRARPPWRTSRYTPMARARTQAGDHVEVAVVKFARTATQARPPMTRAAASKATTSRSASVTRTPPRAPELAARDQRQEGPHGAGEDSEHGGPNEHRLEGRSVPDVAAAGAHGLADALDRSVGDSRLAMPPEERDEQADREPRTGDEDPSRGGDRDDHPAEGRPCRPSDVEARRVQGDRGRDDLRAHRLGGGRL